MLASQGSETVAVRAMKLGAHDYLPKHLVTTDSLVKLIQFADRALPDFIGKRPKIAVAGINPHASEGGMFGDEEASQIEPAIEHCRSMGIDISGPYSPDTIFVLQQPHTPARQAAATGTLLLSSASSSVVPTRPKKV